VTSPQPPPPPSRIRRVLRWLTPSVAAACAGTVVAGLVDARGLPDLGAALASAGYASILAGPGLLLAAVVARGLWAAWQPDQLAAALVDERGGAPRLLAWVLFLAFAGFVLSWATFNGVRVLAYQTQFKPLVVSLAMPVFVLVAAATCTVLSRPVVRALTAGVHRLDTVAHRRTGRSFTTPRLVIAYAAVLMAALPAVGWLASVRPRIGHLDLGILIHPVTAIAVAAAVHLVWRRLRRPGVRAALLAVSMAATATVAAAALWVRLFQPALVLAIWGEPTVAGLVIDRVHDLDAIRADLPAEAFRPVELPGRAHPDVVLITIDTVRFDRTPLAGGPARMPVLAELGRRGAVFEWAFAPGNVTRRSLTSLVLGLSPPRVRGRVSGWALRLDPRHVVLAERFRAAGYETAGFFCCESFWGSSSKRLGLNRGIDHLHIQFDGGVLARDARAWLEQRERAGRARPLFLWMHIFEPHSWTRGKLEPQGLEERRRMYDETLGLVDGFLADAVAPFAKRPPGRQPLIIVTADHGEGLGDHDVPYHSDGLYNSQLRVPLVIAGPGATAQRIDEPIGLVDVAPTVLELAGFVAPGMPAMDGRSLADLVSGKRTPDPDRGYAFAAQVADRSVARGMRAVVEGRWKLIATPEGLELYDVHADPGELRDLARTDRARLQHMRRLLHERITIDWAPPF